MDLTGKPLLKLFAGLDEKTMRGLSVTINGWEAVLESSDGKDSPKHEWVRQKLSKFPGGEYDLGILWRRGELSVWINATEVLKWRPDDAAPVADLLALDSAVQVLDTNVGLGARRAFAFDTIRFDDNFMRSQANDAPAPGVRALGTDLDGLRRTQRESVFAARVVQRSDAFFDEDELYKNRTRRDDYGLGVQISVAEGTPHIVRLTGGSPASHAGLAEDDIFIEVNVGFSVDMTDLGTLHRQLMYGQGDLSLKMYRPGEKTFREYNITREAFKWGVAVEGVPIPPVAGPATRAGDEFSFVMAGEAGWSDYEAEVAVKPLGGGGFGLAVAALSDSGITLFRWRGPAKRGETGRIAGQNERDARTRPRQRRQGNRAGRTRRALSPL